MITDNENDKNNAALRKRKYHAQLKNYVFYESPLYEVIFNFFNEI